MIKIPVEPPVTEYLHRKAAYLRLPLSGTFELTPCCNMNCRMCYVRMGKEEQEAIRPLRTADEWIALAKEAKERGLLYLLLTGGEPFLRPDFKEIFQSLHKMGFVLSINSNGTMINEETLAWLKETPPVRINLTLYGASDETYARLCGNPKGFTQAVHAIHLLKEAGITVKINCSVTPHNVDDLEQIIEFTKEEGLIVQATSYMFPPLRRDSSMIGKNDRFSPEEAAYHAAKIEMFLNGKERFLERMENNAPAALPSDLEENCMEMEGEGIRCRAGKCSFWITWEGKFLPCGMITDDSAADVFEVGFEEAWKQAVEKADAIRLPGTCAGCALRDECKACAAMVYTESGNFHTVPEYRCRMAKAYPYACKKVESEIREED